MKLENAHKNIERGAAVCDEMDFGIDAESIPQILGYLRDSLYSDKILAVVREYSTNAWDAHIEAGCPDRPIEVTMPTRYNLEFRVRDFGYGLSQKDMAKTFTRFGKSTKRDSNDAVGALGLGCKAGFAYVDQFTVISRHKGTKTIYNCYINENRAGKIMVMVEPEPTDEESGLELVIAVKKDDIDRFAEKGRKLYPFFNPRPIIHGVDMEFEEREYLLEGKGWRIHGNSHNSHAVMGNIPYQISNNGAVNLSDDLRSLVHLGVDIDFNIGDLSFTISREGLEYTDKTQKAIRDRLSAVGNVIIDHVKGKIAKAKSFREANIIYRQLWNEWDFREYVQTLVQNSGDKAIFEWGGRKVTGSLLRIPKKESRFFISSHYTQSTRYGSKKPYKWGRRDYIREISATKEIRFFEMDISRGIPRRLDTLKEEMQLPSHEERIMSLNWLTDDAKEREAAIKDYHLDELDMELFSEVTPKKIERDSTGGSANKSKHTAKVFLFNGKSSRYNSVKSDSWDQVSVNLKEGRGVYVTIDRFFGQFDFPKTPWNNLNNHFRRWTYGGSNPSNINDILSCCGHAFGVNMTNFPLYGIKPAMLDKLGKGWVRFEDFIAKAAMARVEQGDLLQRYVDNNSLNKAGCNELRSLNLEGIENKNNPIVKLFNEIEKNEIDKKGFAIFNLVGDPLNKEEHPKDAPKYKVPSPSVDWEGMVQEIAERYPMLPVLGMVDDNDHNPYRRRNFVRNQDIPAVIHYINMVDRMEENN